MRHRPNRRRYHQQFFVAAGTSLPNCYAATGGVCTHRSTDSLLIRHAPHRKWRILFLRVFVAAVTFLTESLPGNDNRDRHTTRWKGFVNYAVERGSDAMIYIPSFINIGSGKQKLKWRIHRHTGWRSYKPTLGK
jgi:hypothetical protein